MIASMTYLFIDTETSGLPDFKLPIDHPSQPHLVAIAAWRGDWEEDEQVISYRGSINAIVKPDGWLSHPRALAIHGITDEYARAFGEPLSDILTRLLDLVADADDGANGGQLIAHNHSFDHRMLLRSFAETRQDSSPLGLLRPFCTMRALTDRIRLPARPGAPPGSFKWPTLDEAYQWLFNRDVPGRENGHEAMVDLLGCKDIFEEGKRREWWR
jgi:DNA polymerase-3 subunit epsilon